MLRCNYLYSMVIVTPTTEERSGVVWAGIIVLVLLFVLVLYLIVTSSYDITAVPDEKKSPQKAVKVVNKTMIPQKLQVEGKEYLLEPEESSVFLLPFEKVIKAVGRQLDGKLVNFSTILRHGRRPITDLYITPSGFKTNLTGSHDVVLANGSPIPVIFVERSANGRRYPSEIVPPNSKSVGHFVSSGSTWEVVRPINESEILASTRVGGMPKELVFYNNELLSN